MSGGDDHREHEPSAPRGVGGTRADRVAVVVNGNAKRVNDDLVEMLDQIVQSGDLFVSRSLEEGREIARTIVRRGYPTVLTGGGDGTFVQMVTWIAEEAEQEGHDMPRFGFLRLGTGNALAWVVGAQNPRHRGVVADLARLRKEGGSRSLRLLDVEGKLTPFAGQGADAVAIKHFTATKEVMQRMPLLRRFATGGLSHFWGIVGRAMPEYLVRPPAKVRVVNEGEDAVRLGVDGEPVGKPVRAGEVLYEGPARMVSMSTIPYYGFGARIFPFADERDDRFNLRVACIGPVDVVVNIRSIWRGSYRSDRVHDFLVDKISIHHDSPVPLQIGGDFAGDRRDVVVSLARRAIRVVDYYSPPPVD